MAEIEPSKAPKTADPVPNEDGAVGSSSAVVDKNIAQNIVKREAPDSLRRLSDALEGWKNKQDEINKKFLDSFEQIGNDLSKIHRDTGNLRQTYDDMRVAQRKASARASRRQTTMNPLPPPKEN